MIDDTKTPRVVADGAAFWSTVDKTGVDHGRGAVVGEKTRIRGSLDGDEDVRVKGHVEGKIHLSQALHVEQGGVVVADIEVKVAVISGVMVGNIQATESVRVAETGRMVGDIVAPRVVLLDGAAFRGRIDTGEEG